MYFTIDDARIQKLITKIREKSVPTPKRTCDAVSILVF